jgi:DNA-binding LacI/PurR family transcriptional regulator
MASGRRDVQRSAIRGKSPVSASVARPVRMSYGQAVQLLQKDIGDRKFVAGDRLPPLRELSASMGMNHRTVRRGIEELVQFGKLEVRPGVGVFVVDQAVPSQKVHRVVLGCRSYMFDVHKHPSVISAYLAGAHRRFASAGVSIQTMVYDGYNIAEQLGDSILTQRIDGFIACTGGVSEKDTEFFASSGIPLVHCGFVPLNHEWPVSIVLEFGAIMRQGVDHLRQLGHRRIAFVGWDLSADNGAVRSQFARMAFDYELGDVRELYLSVPDEEDKQWERIESFFDIKPFPSAVIVHDEFLADVLLAGCRRRGINVPDDLSLVSLHDATPFAHSVPLTAPDSVRMNSEMIYDACDLLDRLMSGEKVPRLRSLTPELIAKASTANVVRSQ